MILGIDPSLTGTGLAFIDHAGRVTDLLTITTKATGSGVKERLARFDSVMSEFGSILDFAESVVIESPAYSSRSGHQHDRSGLWWAIAGAVIQSDLPLIEVTPTARACYATGKGNAAKDQVLANVVRRYPDADVQDNNQADALVLAAMGWHMTTGSPLVDLPQTHTRALAKVVRPEGLDGGVSGPMPGVAS